MLLCSVRSYPPLGINYTGLPLSWTHRPHFPTLVAQCHSSLLRNSLVSSCSGCSGMTHYKVVVELGFLLEAVVSVLFLLTSRAHSFLQPATPVLTLGRAFSFFSLWSPNRRPFGPQMLSGS